MYTIYLHGALGTVNTQGSGFIGFTTKDIISKSPFQQGFLLGFRV